jgi:tripartite-type tricarboxylate transporter receptor subunit TctC
MKKSVLYFLLMCCLFSLMVPSDQLFAAPYYQGKIMTMIVGFSPGGGYDRMTRILARHLPKYIPGKPSIIVQNMGGASSIIAANYLYNIAKPDGLTIGALNAALLFEPVIKLEGMKFDITKYAWIGSAAVEPYVFSIRSDLPYKTIQDLMKSKQTIAMGCSGTGTSDYQFSLILKEFLGLNFNMIIYPSSAECMLAIEKKEADGRSGSYNSLKPYIERGLVRPLVRGRVSSKDVEQLPINEDLSTDKKGKAIMAMYSAADLVGRPYVAPPGTPAERIEILRNAFAKVAKDPELQADAQKSMMDVQYVPAEEVLKVIKNILDQPEDVKKEFAKRVKF